ncbi:MAG: TonB-dependent receptor [Prevotella sp.]|nr:TonB-dependent receptor [Prevotella sp.]
MIRKAISFWAALMPLTVMAEEAVADSSRVVDLDEVVVVSQPKEQFRLRQQPVSSTVFTGSELHQLNVRDLSQLSQYVPNFTMPAYGSRLTSSMYVRGIGTRINNPAVGIYYDNMPLMSKAAFNHHFYQLDRVDVLRGPQGTLYGQNTEGGLVRLYSKSPMTHQGTDVRLGLGTGLYTDVEASHSCRLSDQLAFSVGGFYTGLKGFIDNKNFSEKNDKSNEAGGKLRLVFEPTDRLDFDLVADYQHVDQNGFAYGEYDLATGKVDDPATTLMNTYRRNMLNTGLSISYRMPRLLLTSTTSYQFLDDKMVMDQDYMTPDFLRLEQSQRQHAVTQELALKSLGNTVWQHSTGLFLSHQWLRTDAPVYFMDAFNRQMEARLSQLIPAMMLQAMIDGGMPEAAAQQQVAAMNFSIGNLDMSPVPGLFHTPQLNLGIFHESNIRLTDCLTATLGLRYDYSRVKIDYETAMTMTAQASMTVRGQQMNTPYEITSALADQRADHFSQLLPKLGLTWRVTPAGSNVYASVAKGYRAGGFNIQMFSDILQSQVSQAAQSYRGGEPLQLDNTPDVYDNIRNTIAYKPEESWNYELGSRLNLFGGRVHADLALFYMQIRNQQLSVMSEQYNFGRIMVNAGKSHSLGAELALRGQAVGGRLDWGGTYAYTSAKFDEYDEYNGRSVPFVPQHTFSLMADYRLLPRLTLGANLSGQGKIWWDEANTYSQNLYAVLGAHADYDFGVAVVSLWGRNLTDTGYNTFAISSSAAGGQHYFAQRANPLQVGIDVRLHF